MPDPTYRVDDRDGRHTVRDHTGRPRATYTDKDTADKAAKGGAKILGHPANRTR